MDSIFMNSENSKTSDPHILLLNLPDKINLKRSERYVALSNLSIYYEWKYIKQSSKNNKFKPSAPTWNEEVELPDGSFTFKIKTGYYLKLFTPETMKLLGSTKSEITKYENAKNVSRLENTELVLIHCNIVNNDYQQDSRVLYTFVSNKSFDQLLDISPKNFIFLKTFNSEFSYIKVWFTDQNSKLLEIDDKISITLVTN